MNKELIKKYKAEFEHWLNGGEIRYKHKDSVAWWDRGCWDYSTNYVQAIIIKDEYVEFRKALAEGKTIQIINKFNEEWMDLNMVAFSGPAEYYRIKPEEHTFKVEDWVINTKPPYNFGMEPSAPFCITQDWLDHIKEHGKTIQGNTRITGDLENFIPWQPKLGEWCWFHNGTVESLYFYKFHSIISEGYIADIPKDIEHVMTAQIFKYCEPFTGNLPTIIKDN